MKTLFVCAFLLLAQVMAMAEGTKPVPTRVTYDKYNRLLKNGKPWFPIVFTPGPPPLGAMDPNGRDAVEVLAAGGVDGFRINRIEEPEGEETCAKYLDWFARHDVYAFPYLKEISVFDPRAPGRQERLRKVVERFRYHPALAVWKTEDEPAWGKAPIEGLMEAYKYLKQIDPDHPAWMAHAPRDTVELLHEYCKACDITGLDIYPISVPMGKHGHFPNKEISVVGDYAEWINRAVDGKKPFFMILQVCWSGVIPPDNILVYPTFHQERYMAYQAIIKGARGLVFFGMPVALQGRDAELGYNWTFWNETLHPLLTEIGKGSELHSALLAPNSALPLKATGVPDIEFTVREVGPYAYILAAKREGSPALIKFTGSFLKGQAEVMFENRHLDITNGEFTDRFERNDVHIYKLRLP